ncbi:MAG: hypothetical protein RJB34_1389 [Pseudomonadota bacterium]|jgi:hypothetical protein
MVKSIDENYKSGIILKPMQFFILGLVYYFYIPPFSLYVFSDILHIRIAMVWINQAMYDYAYYADGLIIIASWALGDYLGKKFTKPKHTIIDTLADKDAYGFYLVLLMGGLAVLFTAIAIASGAQFFTGYEDYDVLVLGPYATLAFTTVMLRGFFIDPKIRMGFTIVFIASAVILLGLGSRMLVLLATINMGLDYIYNNKIKLKSIIILLVGSFLTVLTMLYVGVVRDGGSVGFETLFGVLLAEPTFTSISSVLYFEMYDGRPIFAVPKDLIAAFVNFIPSVIFPGKIEVLDAMIHNYGNNPFGASALLFNLYANFGYFYPIFLIIIAFHYARLYVLSKSSILYKSIYFATLPLLLFYIQREGLVTVIKVLVFNSYAFPLILFSLLYLLKFLRPLQSSVKQT